MLSRLSFLWLVLSLALASPGLRAQSQVGEYDLKAALLYNFTRFIEWPGEGSGDFRICIAGRDPFGSGLNTLTTRTVREQPIRIERQPGDFRNCQIVFVAAGAPLPQPSPGVLVVADDPAALNRGAAVALGLEGDRVVFDINQEVAARANLKVSYKLQRLARPLRPAGP